MPRENRKRGKRTKKPQEVENSGPVQESNVVPDEPSWIKHAVQERENLDAPFGYVDADVKAYFKTVDLKIRGWQEEDSYHYNDRDEDVDPNEDRRMLLMASLSELFGKELQLATDPDCSAVLERMAYSMDDFVRRVFMDSLAGSYAKLAKHRFASHVCQTLFALAAETVGREIRGVFPPVPDQEDKGVLRTMTQLVVDACEELCPSLSSLVMDPFASHVLRGLLLSLCPNIATTLSNLSLRSKKSAAYKAKQGPMKSVLIESQSSTPGQETSSALARSVPPEFAALAKKMVMEIRRSLDENEVRAMAGDKVASPTLQILLEVEAATGQADQPGSLMDRMLVGMITNNKKIPPEHTPPSDYVMTLLRDTTSSHLLETLIIRSPPATFRTLWLDYFVGKLKKLAVHPVANFVLAKAIDRLDGGLLSDSIKELEGTWSKMIKEERTGVLRAIIDRACTLQIAEQQLVAAVCGAFELPTMEDQRSIFPCVLRLKPLPIYLSAKQSRPERTHDLQLNEKNKSRRPRVSENRDPLAPTIQGAVLLQSMLRLSEPHNQLILKSIESLDPPELLAVACHATSSRVLDVVFESPTVPKRSKRMLVLAFIGHFHELVDDRIGSRVADRCWADADPYLKEKIAKSMIPHEQFLRASHYGKYFARKLNLSLLQRRPEEWKSLQSKSKTEAPTLPPPTDQKKRKTIEVAQESEGMKNKPEADKIQPPRKKKKKGDEIDTLFESIQSTKFSRVPSNAITDGATNQGSTQESETMGQDNGLRDILGAIRAAPKSEMRKRK